VTREEWRDVAEARGMVRLRDGRVGVLIRYPPVGPTAQVRIGGWYHRVPAVDVLAVAEEEAPPAWVTHERLYTLLRLLHDVDDRRAERDTMFLHLHRPTMVEEVCRECGHFWPCPPVEAVGARRSFVWAT